ncbi:MAG TPA: thioredoxin domain-containing protein [Acidimicrobiales bacterium]|nr:thioredoxin domain-containing protein [Acidimicrobiales bacterium]
MSADIVELSFGNFDAVVGRAALPVVADFWSDACPPCVQVRSILHEVAEEYREKAIVGSIDVKANPGLAERFSVASVPTLIIFVGGEPVRRLVGARPKRHIVRELSSWTH